MFNRLPTELKLHIFSFLKPKDLGHLACVSKSEKVNAEDDSVWKDDVITDALIEKTHASAKELYRYRLLLVNPSNYANFLLNGTITFEEVKKQLIERCASPGRNEHRQISYIIGPTCFNRLGELFSPIESSFDSLDLDPPHPALSPFSTILYLVEQMHSDVDAPSIPSLKFICCDLTLHFDLHFSGCTFPWRGDKGTQQTLAQSVGVVVFSNDTDEMNTICCELNRLSGAQPMPFIFLASFDGLSMDKINARIVDVIVLDQIVHSKAQALTFWQVIKGKLDNLTQLAVTLCSEKDNPKTNSYCMTM